MIIDINIDVKEFIGIRFLSFFKEGEKVYGVLGILKELGGFYSDVRFYGFECVVFFVMAVFFYIIYLVNYGLIFRV